MKFLGYLDKYNLWMDSEYIDSASKDELKGIIDEKEIEDRFYKNLEFGTGGLRGIVAAGDNRMNVYTVGKVTKGLAEYLKSRYEGDISVCIAHDSRIMSREFSETCTEILCGSGIKVNLFDSLRPTPMLSYAVRHTKSKAGIVITASHNPKEYNGYKVYGDDGGQVTDENAMAILGFINKINDFSVLNKMGIAEAEKKGLLHIIGEEVDKAYYEKVKALTIRKSMVDEKAANLNILYTPIHGSGNIPVRRVLKELRYSNLNVVTEQEMPDGNFPTAPKPNPEDPAVFKIAIKMAENIKPDIIFGTDPDCDRIGVVAMDSSGEYKNLTGNQMGILLTHYILSSLKDENKLPVDGFIIKTIVTTTMACVIAKDYGVEDIDVLTGFKYIGEKIKELHDTKKGTFLFGFEESYGYLAGDFVRDKDAVVASSLVCEMALYYKEKGINLFEALNCLYEKYGYYKEKLIYIDLKGKEGQEKIKKSLDYLRHSMNSCLGKIKIIRKADYKLGIEKDLINIIETKTGLPSSDALKFTLEDGSWFVVRPSGTEPKMKIYLSVRGTSHIDSEEKMNYFEKAVMDIINDSCS